MRLPEHITVAALACLSTILCSLADPLEQERTLRVKQFRVTQWTSEEGLPQNTITSLLQTRQGYIWIGTRYGVARYDGVRLTDYSWEFGEANDNELEVRGMAEDAHGRLWFHNQSELLWMEAGRFSRVEPPVVREGERIEKVRPSASDGLWVLTQEALIHVAKRAPGEVIVSRRQIRNQPKDCSIVDFFEDRGTNLWFAAGGGMNRTWLRVSAGSDLAEYATNIFQQPEFDGGVLRFGRNGTAWIARPRELLRIDERGKFERFPATQAWNDQAAQDIIEDARGNVWILCYGGVQLYRFADREFTGFGPQQGLRHSSDLRCLICDREANIWVGSGSGGLYRVQERRLLSLLSGLRSENEEIYSIARGANGRTWLASPYGLLKHEGGVVTFYTNTTVESRYNFSRVRPVFEHSSGEVYFGVDFLGLHRLNNGVYERQEFPAGPPTERRRITSFYEGADGTLWMATPMGLVERRGDSLKTWRKADGLTDERTFGLAAGLDGSVWVGTRNGGVCRLKDGRIEALRKADGLLSDNAWPLLWETNGTLWLGTPAGINRVRGKEIRSITRHQGLVENIAYCLINDNQGQFWSFGNRGIWRVPIADMNAVADGRARHVHAISYGEADGMPSAEGNGDDQPNAVRLENGEMWFPTTRGVVVVDPAKLPLNEVRPPVVIERVIVDGAVIYRDGQYPMVKGARRDSGMRLRLAPGMGRVVEVRYTATTFIDSERTHFRYRLLGNSEEWREAESRREAFYTDLKPGRYRFEVEARSHQGLWSERPVRFEFEVEPHLYETWPFYAASGLVAVTLLGTLHSRRLNNARRMQGWQKERALQEERSRISKDLHDDLGANLTGLALKIEVARHQMHQPEQVAAQLSSAAETVRGLVERMREVIWSLNPQCDTLESFRAYCCQYAENFLASAGLRCRFEMPVELPERMLSAEERHHLLLVIKEALNNAARHAGGTEVRLVMRLDDSLLHVTVADNGRGFAPSRAKTTVPDNSGQGLQNMKNRVELLGGRFERHSEIGVGTSIHIRVPLPDRR